MSVRVHAWRGEAAITLAAGGLEATFLPDLGMLGTSLRHRGEELLALPGGLAGYQRGHATGLPLLAPWANRLPGRHYRIDGVEVDLEGLPLHTDGNGLPIHGTMGRQAWRAARVHPMLAWALPVCDVGWELCEANHKVRSDMERERHDEPTKHRDLPDGHGRCPRP